MIQKDDENKENYLQNDSDIVSKVTDKVFMNNSFEIEQNVNQKEDHDYEKNKVNNSNNIISAN